MGNDIIIKVEGVSKKFCNSFVRSRKYGIQDVARDILGINSKPEKLRKGEFWAVDGVSFELKKGETLGIIGPNGCGKTTLLKMLNGIFMPDKGRIEVKGKVGALIAIGAGFHPLLSGRENIYVSGAILGMSKKEIDKKFDSIVGFADIGDFLDSPIKFYSDGMYVRLGFAVAIHCQPDILLVDEILAVGDKDFQIKCYQKMHEVKKRGITIILVSHNEYTIREHTENSLYINNGKMRFLGPSEEAASRYIKEMFENKAMSFALKGTGKYQSAKKAEIVSLKFFDRNGTEGFFIESGQEMNIVLECRTQEELDNPIFGVNFYDNSGFMYCANSAYENVVFGKIPPGNITIKIGIPHLYLPTNTYFCSAIIAEESVDNLIDWHNMSYRFTVGRARNSRGSIKLPTKWEVEQI